MVFRSNSTSDVHSATGTFHSQEDQFARSCLDVLIRSISALAAGIFAGIGGMFAGGLFSIRPAIGFAVVVGVGAFVMGTPAAAISALVGTVFFSVIAAGAAVGGCVAFIIGCGLGAHLPDTQWINDFR